MQRVGGCESETAAVKLRLVIFCHFMQGGFCCRNGDECTGVSGCEYPHLHHNGTVFSATAIPRMLVCSIHAFCCSRHCICAFLQLQATFCLPEQVRHVYYSDTVAVQNGQEPLIHLTT